jgi:hypothetical protein
LSPLRAQLLQKYAPPAKEKIREIRRSESVTKGQILPQPAIVSCRSPGAKPTLPKVRRQRNAIFTPASVYPSPEPTPKRAAPFLRRKIVAQDTHLTSTKPRKISYTPYTIDDYKVINTRKFDAKGLGNGDVGTDRWKQVKAQSDRKHDYAARVREMNRDKLAEAVRDEPPAVMSLSDDDSY